MHRVAVGVVLSLALASACSPTRDQHGWAPDSKEPLEVQPGVDTKTTVLARMGTPSTTGMFEQTAWYYIASTEQRIAFYIPKTTQREITVVRFGADDVVSKVDRFGLEKGRVIAYNDDKTPTRGRELGLLEQLFGNVGAAAPVLTDDDQNRRQRR